MAWGRGPGGWGGGAAQRDGTNLLDFLDVTVLVDRGDGLRGLDPIFVLEQGCNL